jgi:hypothetical protein
MQKYAKIGQRGNEIDVTYFDTTRHFDTSETPK